MSKNEPTTNGYYAELIGVPSSDGVFAFFKAITQNEASLIQQVLEQEAHRTSPAATVVLFVNDAGLRSSYASSELNNFKVLKLIPAITWADRANTLRTKLAKFAMKLQSMNREQRYTTLNASNEKKTDVTSDLPKAVGTGNKIPTERRTKPLTKIRAARLLGRDGDKSAATEWLSKCIEDGTISAEKLNRQSWIFDIDQFPTSVHKKLKATQGD